MFDWFLSLNPILGIFLLTVVYSLIIVAIYSLFMDVSELRAIKSEMDKVRKKLTSAKDKKELETLKTKTIELSLKYNQKSMKSFIYTTLPAILIFGFLTSHYTYQPLTVNQPFNVSIYLKQNLNVTLHELISSDVALKNISHHGNVITYTLLPKKEGKYSFEFEIKGKNYKVPFIVTRLYDVTPAELKINDNNVKKITIDYKPLKLVPFSIFGFYPGRLTFYILFSTILNILFRKWFNLP